MTIQNKLYEGIRGFTHGYQYAKSRGEEEEIRQGKTYLLTVMPLHVQVITLTGLIENITDLCSATYLSKGVDRVAGIFPKLFFPVLLFSAAVKEGKYKDLRYYWNKAMDRKYLYPFGGVAVKGCICLYSLSQGWFFLFIPTLLHLGTYVGFSLRDYDRQLENLAISLYNKMGLIYQQIEDKYPEEIESLTVISQKLQTPSFVKSLYGRITKNAPLTRDQVVRISLLSLGFLGLYAKNFVYWLPLYGLFAFRNYQNYHQLHPTLKTLVTKGIKAFASFKSQLDPLYDKATDYLSQNALLPEKLSPSSIRWTHRIAEYTGDVVQVSLLLGLVYLGYLGSYYYVAAMALSVGYHTLESKGLPLPKIQGTDRVYVPLRDYGKKWSIQSRNVIPACVSEFNEKYLSLVSIIGYLFMGQAHLFIKLFLLRAAARRVCPSSLYPLQQGFDRFLESDFVSQVISNSLGKSEDQSLMHLYQDPEQSMPTSLSEADAPLQKQTDLSFDKIQDILKGRQRFEINQAYLAKGLTKSLPSDHEYEKLWTFFQQIKWDEHLPLVRAKLKDNERFWEEMVPVLEKSSEEILSDFDTCLQEYSKRTNTSVNEIILNRCKQEMRLFVSCLNGTHSGKGSPDHLREARLYAAQIVYYLEHLPEDKQIERQDILLNLALECGDFCHLKKRDFLKDSLTSLVKVNNKTDVNPDELFEAQFDLHFLKSRELEMQRIYATDPIIQGFLKLFPGKNMHIYVELKKYFYGFMPLTERERAFMIPLDILYRKFIFGPALKGLIERAQKLALGLISSIGERPLNEYIRNFIQNNPKLEDSQKEALLAPFLDPDLPSYSKGALFTLFLYIRGVIKESQERVESKSSSIEYKGS